MKPIVADLAKLGKQKFQFSDPVDAERIVAGSVLGGWGIALPCGECEFTFPALGSAFAGLAEMSPGDRENLDKWLAVEIACDIARGVWRIEPLYVEIERASHEPREIVVEAVAAVHRRFIRARVADLVGELGWMVDDENREIGPTIGYASKALRLIREIEHVKLIPPSEEWRVERYTRRIEAARTVRGNDRKAVAA